MTEKDTRPIAPSRRKALLRAFKRVSLAFQKALTPRLGEDRAAALAQQALDEYQGLIHEIPEAGKTLLSGARDGTYVYLAYYKVLKREGHAVEEIGALYEEAFAIVLSRVPRWLARPVFRLLLPWGRRRLRKDAQRTEKEPDPNDFRLRYVEAQGREHDLGLDITDCVVCKAFGRHGAEEAVPYLCALDDKMSDFLDLGLRRSGTQALGASCCDFRYRVGGPPKPLRSQYSLPIVESSAADDRE